MLGIDFDTAKCDLARKFGAETVDLSKGEDPIVKAVEFSRGRGVDGLSLQQVPRVTSRYPRLPRCAESAAVLYL